MGAKPSPKTINARKGVKTSGQEYPVVFFQIGVQKLSMPVRALRLNSVPISAVCSAHSVQKLSMPVRALRPRRKLLSGNPSPPVQKLSMPVRALRPARQMKLCVA